MAEDDRPGCGPLRPAPRATGHSTRALVYSHVRTAGSTSRVRITSDLGLSPATVTTLTAELIRDGHLVETAPDRIGPASRGRPRLALSVAPGSASFLGVCLGEREDSAALLDATGGVLATVTRPSPGRPRTLDDAVTAAATLAREVTDDIPAAAGLALPGFVASGTGTVIWSPGLTERDVPLGPALADSLGCPVAIENDANAATLDALWFGRGREVGDFVVLTNEGGLGMGYVHDHELVSGSTGVGLELGHIKVQLDGAACRCGQRGCLEAYVADYALARTAGADPETLLARARAGDPTARAAFDHAGRYLALGIGNVASLLDPALVLLIGGSDRYEYLLTEATLPRIGGMLLETGGPGPRIEVAPRDPAAWARGAAALSMARFTGDLLSR